MKSFLRLRRLIATDMTATLKSEMLMWIQGRYVDNPFIALYMYIDQMVYIMYFNERDYRRLCLHISGMIGYIENDNSL